MGSRRTARELALKILYQLEMGGRPLEEVLTDFWNDQIYQSDIQNFAESLSKGVVSHKADIDKEISLYADNWDVSRMVVIDRIILRLAIYEIRYCDDIPHAVSINEALEIAKKYSTEESSRFVNGILDRAAKKGLKSKV